MAASHSSSAPSPRRRRVVPVVAGVLLLLGMPFASARTASSTASTTTTSTTNAGSPEPTVSISDVSVAEPLSGVRDALFAISLSEASSKRIRVDYATADGSAVAGLNYQPQSGTVTFDPGQTSVTVAVGVLNDRVTGSDKTFFVTLAEPDNAELGDGLGQAMISDSDRMVSISDSSVAEPPGGTTVAVFQVQLQFFSPGGTSGSESGELVPDPSPLPVSVGFATADGTGVAGLNYVATRGTLTFHPGEASKTLAIPVLDDHASTGDKTFSVALFDPVNADLGRALGTATIAETGRTISVEDTTVTESPHGQVDAVFPVTLSAPSPVPVAVDYATADGTALAGQQYVAHQGTLVFPPGVGSLTIPVRVVDDLIDEGDTPQTFALQLSNPRGADLTRSRATGTIVEHDRSVSIEDATVSRGDTGTVDTAFTVRLSSPAAVPVTVDYATADGTAQASTDYRPLTGTLTIPAGETEATITVPVLGTRFERPQETFTVRLSHPVNATLGRDHAVGTILPHGQGYWLVGADGGVFPFGDAPFVGSAGAMALNRPIVGMAATPTGAGYWLVAADGGIFSYGDAAFYGSTGAIRLNQPIVGMAATPTGAGYWLVAADGGIFAFGDAAFYGSTGAISLNRPIAAMAATPSGAGYWLVAADGGIFGFGDAAFYGSTASDGESAGSRPVVGMAATPTGRGYWLVRSDGTVAAFGDGAVLGGLGTAPLRRPVVGMAATLSGNGYWITTADGGVFAFGDARFEGSAAAIALRQPIVGVARLTGRLLAPPDGVDGPSSLAGSLSGR